MDPHPTTRKSLAGKIGSNFFFFYQIGLLEFDTSTNKVVFFLPDGNVIKIPKDLRNVSSGDISTVSFPCLKLLRQKQSTDGSSA